MRLPSPRMAMPSKLPRRVISWPALHVALVVLVVLAVPALALLITIDLVRGRWRLNLTRVYALVLAIVTVEFVVFWSGIVSGIITANGRLISGRRWMAFNFWLQNRWVAAQITDFQTPFYYGWRYCGWGAPQGVGRES